MKKTKKKANKKPPLKNKALVIYIYNIVEDEWSFLSSVRPKSKKYEMMNDCNVYTECYLFTNSQENEFLYISPLNISDNFINYFQSVTLNKKINVMVPKIKTGLICKDLYNDKELFQNLIKTAKKYKEIKLISYAVSRELFELKEKLIQQGINITTPEAPEMKNEWTVNYFGSKSGIRQLALKSRVEEPEFIIPEGVICFGIQEAAKIAANRYVTNNGVVLKTNKGSGGDGLLIFREKELPGDYKTCENKILEKLRSDGYWDKSPIIVEELIKVNFKSPDSFPNVEFKIHDDGKIEMLYYCIMIVTKEGKYSGLDMHKDVLIKKMVEKIIRIGNFIAKQYAMSGYQGHFDVDMITDVKKQIYVCETNTRNTGGTDIYKLVKSIYGNNFLSDVYVLNRDNFKFDNEKKIAFTDIIKRLKPILLNHNKKEGVVLSASKSLEFNQLSYTVLGKNRKAAYNLQEEFFRLMEFFN